jgi:branched-chain amino acid transport system ATP-binding protein
MTALTLSDITVRFGGLVAVKDVSFKVHPQEIVSLIGPTGAGKTTVFNVTTGVYIPTEGSVRVNECSLSEPFDRKQLLTMIVTGIITGILLFVAVFIESLWAAAITDHYIYQEPFAWSAALQSLWDFWNGLDFLQRWGISILGAGIGMLASHTIWKRGQHCPEIAVRCGAARTFQNIRLFSAMSALENVLVGMHEKFNCGFFSEALLLPSTLRERKRLSQRALEILGMVGLTEEARLPASKLSYGHARRLEIARALATEPKLLLLDEPAAGMNPSESAELMGIIRSIRDTGITVLLIEHHMKVVMEISDRIVVLDHGEKIAEGTPEEVRRNPAVIEAYLGQAEDL